VFIKTTLLSLNIADLLTPITFAYIVQRKISYELSCLITFKFNSLTLLIIKRVKEQYVIVLPTLQFIVAPHMLPMMKSKANTLGENRVGFRISLMLVRLHLNLYC
jgi:hypothetical protein